MKMDAEKRIDERSSLAFHSEAEDLLVTISSKYSRQVGAMAERFANNDGSAEVQPGHVARARLEVERTFQQRSHLRSAWKSFLQIAGSAMIGVSASGMLQNSAQSISDGSNLIVMGALGLAGVIIGVTMKG